jgi:nephrocystin-3
MAGTWKTARVFISSTFRDMHAERDHLVKVIFPRLREQLLPYRVELIDIDLRWGVSREQAENDQVIALCLGQIDECRPFFLSLLGGRYGWVPPRIPPEVCRQFPWISSHPGASVTELEIHYGALQAQQVRTLFCFRKEQALSSIPEPTRSAVFVETNPAARAKLAHLKERIRTSSQPVAEYPCRWGEDVYDRPSKSFGRLVELETFGTLVHDWLWAAIRCHLGLPDQPFALSAVDPLQEEADFHERFLEARQRAYVGRQALNEALHAYAERDDEVPCLVSGPSGSGKSAALAQFVSTFQDRHPEAQVLVHFAGASPRSTALHDLLGRLCAELKQRFGLAGSIPETTAERVPVFRAMLASVPVETRLVLVLDALNQLETGEGAHDLHWLPERVLPHVRVVASCLAGPAAPLPVLAVCQRRGYRSLEVEPLSDAERRQIIREIPKLSAKILDERQIERLLANPATANPLFLLVALEELRNFGSFERLNRRIEELPREGDTVTALFEQVFERLEDEFDSDLVKEVLKLLVCSRQGLSERELQDLTAGQSGADELFVLLRQLRPYLLYRSGRLDFYHVNVATAAEHRYLRSPAAKRQTHLRLAIYFKKRAPDKRQVEELPWQLAKAQAWQNLVGVLTDLPFFRAAWEANRFEVMAYWTQVETCSPLRKADAYRSVVSEPSQWLDRDVEHIATLLAQNNAPEALLLRNHLVERYRLAGDRVKLQSAVNKLAVLLWWTDLDKSMELLKEAEGICRDLGDKDGLRRAIANQAGVLQNQGDLVGAMNLRQVEEQLCHDLNDSEGLAVSFVTNRCAIR